MYASRREESDRERWDRKYFAGEGPAHFEPNRLLIEQRHRLGFGRALDVACGFGGNALYLASLGYRVDAVDASGVALARAQTEAQRRGLHLNLVQADLNRWWLPGDCYDLVVVFHYLNRRLLPQLAAALRPGGMLFQANRNTYFMTIRPDFDPAYLLEPGELYRLAVFGGLEVLHYVDGAPGEEHVSQLIARRAT
jgi:tellurite methyltransferase